MSKSQSKLKIVKPKNGGKKSKSWLLQDVESKYKKKGEIEHILALPDTQIGSTEFSDYNFWCPDEDNEGNISFSKRKCTFTPGLYKIVDEILVNAYDQVIRLKELAKELEDDGEENDIEFVKNIKIEIDRDTNMISVLNDGDGIDVAIHSEHNVYVPQMIFGDMRTSTNYNKDESGIKIVGGRNGFGAKLANIFSKKFIVETLDARRGLHFEQTYENNMSVRHEPVVKKTKKSPFTKITFYPDLERFGYNDGFDDDFYDLIVKRAYDIAACTENEINVYLNGEKINHNSFEKYISLYLGSKSNYPRVFSKFNDRWEVGATLSMNQQFEQISFVNGVATIRGGKHVDYIADQLSDKLAKYISKKKNLTNLKKEHVKDNLMVFIKCSIENASFDTQTKECMTLVKSKFGSTCTIDNKFVEELADNCGVLDKVVEWHEIKNNLSLKKSDGTKKSKLMIPKLKDAIWAGKKNKSHEAVLILTEGDSASRLATDGIAGYEENGKFIGQDKFGVFPLRGKLINVDTAAIDQILDNNEIKAIKQIIGLKEGMVYNDNNIGTLRYGSVMIMTDQDPDGSHIKGLVINMFKTKWPSLFEREGFLTSLRTPIVKAYKGSKKNETIKQFYSIQQFEQWKQNNDTRGWRTKYFKGLATSGPKEGKEYFSKYNENNSIYSVGINEEDIQNSYDKISLAFQKERADDRKKWLKVYDKDEILDYDQNKISYCEFIDKDLKHFSNQDNIRSIPSIMDGLKESQRKCLFGAIKGNYFNSECKVTEIGMDISKTSAYHHGDTSLYGTIISMAQDYPGSNNMPLFEALGQFGTRVSGGKDSGAPRYLFTKLNKISKILFNSHDNKLLKYLDDDGKPIEPEFYVPIIPTILCNGSVGIGTGYSTKIPCFNPRDIINNIRLMNDGQEPNELIPWYQGFSGTIHKITSNTYLSKGTYNVINDNTVEINELPIGKWTEDYKNFLIKLSGTSTKAIKSKSPTKNSKTVTKKLIKSFEERNGSYTVKFIIKFEDDVLPKLLDGLPDKKGINLFEKTMGLTTNINISNMTAFDPNNILKKYKNTIEIFKDFYEVRNELYVRRRKEILSQLKKDKMKLTWQAKFILAIISEDKQEKIIIEKKSKKEVYKILESKGYPKEINGKLYTLDKIQEIEDDDNKKAYNYLLNMQLYNLTQEKIDELLAEKEKREAEYNAIKEKTHIDLWNDDLDALQTAYDEFEEELVDKMNLNDSEGLKKKKRKPKKLSAKKPKN